MPLAVDDVGLESAFNWSRGPVSLKRILYQSISRWIDAVGDINGATHDIDDVTHHIDDVAKQDMLRELSELPINHD